MANLIKFDYDHVGNITRVSINGVSINVSGQKVELQPVRHGEWVGTDFDGYADGNPVYYLWQCSCCHEEYERDGLPPWYDYCPNCGAKMDGGA